MNDLLRSTDKGLYCQAGDFYIDPWLPVERAVITHAHSDHARWGSHAYLTSDRSAEVLRLRVGDDALIESMAYGESQSIGSVKVSLHPAGHILGSSQVRVEHNGEVWVVSGDYKVEPDATAGAFEVVPCNTFVTESTFGLPLFCWPQQEHVFADMNRWWAANAEQGITSIVYAYALGKAQRVLAMLDSSIGSILGHGSVMRFLPSYAAAGIKLPPVLPANDLTAAASQGRAIVVAPPSADAPGWLRRFGERRTSFASGWMQLRKHRRSRGIDRGFVVSDHVDWNALIGAVNATGAERVLVTHGYKEVAVRYFREHGLDASVLEAHYEGEEGSIDQADPPNEPA